MNDLGLHGLIGTPLKILDTLVGQYVVEAGNTISGGDLVDFVNGMVSKYKNNRLGITHGFTASRSASSAYNSVGIPLTDTKFVIAYYSGGTQRVHLHVVDTANSVEFVFGAEVTTVSTTTIEHTPDLLRLSATQFLVQTFTEVSLFTVSGTTLTLTSGWGKNSHPQGLKRISDTRVVSLSNNSGSLYVQALDIGATTVTTVGSMITVHTNAVQRSTPQQEADICVLTPSEFLVTWVRGSDQLLMGRVVRLSGTTYSLLGSETAIISSIYTTEGVQVHAISSTKAVVAIGRINSTERVKAAVLTINTSTGAIAVGTPVQLPTSHYTAGTFNFRLVGILPIHGATIDDIYIFHTDAERSPFYAICKVSGTTILIEKTIPIISGLSMRKPFAHEYGVVMGRADNSQAPAVFFAKRIKPMGIAKTGGVAGQTIKAYRFL